MESFDAVVVGAGLAGLATARQLASRGLSVALVDRKTDLTRAIHTTGIFVRKTLEDFAFPVGTLGPPVRQVTLLGPNGRALDLASQHDEFRVGRMGSLYQSLLADAQQRGTRWYPGARLLAVEPGPGTTSTLRLDLGGRPVSLFTRYLVGADGARSFVAPELGLDQNRHWIVGVEEVLAGVRSDGPPKFWCLVDPLIAPGYLAWLIHDGEEVHLGVGGYGRRFVPGTSMASWRELAGRLLDLSGARLVQRRGGLIPVGGVLRRIVSPRGLLVGDAAGAPSPLTAGGLDPCLRLAALGADVTERWLATGDHQTLARYDGRRFRARFVSRLAMRRLFSSLTTRGMVAMAFGALGTPIGRAFAQHVFFGRGSFPEVGVPLGVPGRLEPGHTR